MEDKQIISKMMKGGFKEFRAPTRKEGIIEVAAGVFDDYTNPIAQQNRFYRTWINLVMQHREGLIKLSGKFRTATGFISVASQFNEHYVPTISLLGANSNIFSQKTTSFLSPKLHRAIVAKNSEVILDYIQDQGDWELSYAEVAALSIRMKGVVQ